MSDFWPSCGYLLLAKRGKHLEVTPDFLRAYLSRPELLPIDTSGPAEIGLHERLLDDPARRVDDAEIAAVEDADARENYRIWLRFRARLLGAPSLEAAYAALFQGGGVDVPPVFVHELTQVIVRHVLGDAPAPFAARAGEMFFRTQKISVQDGVVMAADEATVERFASGEAFGHLGELLASQRVPLRTAELDVMSEGTAAAYWGRDEQHDFAICLNRGEPALDALCRLMERWILHFEGIETTIQTARAIEDERWVWHIGLDAEASGLLNDLYNRRDVDRERMERLLCLFVLRFTHEADMRADLAGRPVYLAMAMDRGQRLRLKPQNLLLNLPASRRRA